MAKLSEAAIADLSVAERLSLIADLWDSLTDAELPPSEPQRVEIDRRLASFETDRDSAVAWEDLKAELSTHRP